MALQPVKFSELPPLPSLEGDEIIPLAKDGENYSTTPEMIRAGLIDSVAWGEITGTLANQTDLQAALNSKEDSITAGTTAQYWRGDKTWQSLNKAAVGLANVDNTSDLDKPISNAVQEAIDDLVSKSELVFNVKDYGAVGNGTTDDLSAIQDAIDAAEAAGGTVYFPHGTYIVSGTPQVTIGGITIRGEGAKSRILLATAAMNAAGTTIGIWVNGGSNVLIENLAVDGNFENVAKNGTYGSGALWSDVITEYGAQTVKNYLYSFTGVDSSTYLLYRCPVRITNATNVIVDKCTITNSISAGVLIDADTVDRTQNVLVTNCRMSMIWDNAIYFHKGVRYGSAIGNILSDTQYAGVTAIYCNQILITNNNIRNAGPSASDSAGIELCAVDGAQVVGNMVEKSSFAGITLKNSDETNITGGAGGAFVKNTDVLISGNHFKDCHHPQYPSFTNAGVNVIQSDNTQIVANKIEDCDYGVSLGFDLADTVVQDNVIRNNVSWGINVGNSSDVINTVISGNIIDGNGANGVAAHAPIIFLNNVVRDNQGDGLNISPPPSGLASKTDRIQGNMFTDNLYNGVNTQAGPGNTAVIRHNLFSNQERALLVGTGANKGDVHFSHNHIQEMSITSYNRSDLSSSSVAYANYETGSVGPIYDGDVVRGPLTQDGGDVLINQNTDSQEFKVGGSSNDGMIWVREGFDRIGFGITGSDTVDHEFDVNLGAYFRKTAVIRGVVGIGNNGFDDSNKTLNIDHTNTVVGSDQYGFFSVQRANPSSNYANIVFGGFIQAQVLGGNIRNISALTGEKVFAEHNGTGTVSAARANDMQIRVTSGGIIADARAVNIATPSISGGSSIASNRGINVEDQSGPTTTHGLYFEGTGTNNDINWQGDTILYRAAAGSLKTEGSITAGTMTDVLGSALVVIRNNIAVGRIDNNASGLRVQAQTGTLQLRGTGNNGISIASTGNATFDGSITAPSITAAATTGDAITVNGIGTANSIVRLLDDGTERGALYVLNAGTIMTLRSQVSLALVWDNATSIKTISVSGTSFTVPDPLNFVLGTTTGTKIGTSASQKLALWNANPIVQPTTAIAAATRVGGGGNTITDTDTFDGYTISQIAKALRNMGALA